MVVVKSFKPSPYLPFPPLCEETWISQPSEKVSHVMDDMTPRSVNIRKYYILPYVFVFFSPIVEMEELDLISHIL